MDAPPVSSPLAQLVYQYVIPLGITGLLAVIGWAGVRVAQWMAQKLKESRWFAALDFAQRWAFDALLFAGAEFRSEYATLIADGELSSADRLHLRNLGTSVLKKWLDERKTKMLQEALGLGGIQFDQFLSSQVEKAIVKLPTLAAGAAAAAIATALKPSESGTASALTPAIGVPATRP